ncbi:MBL fold metallo-hydrolase [Rhodovastum atsumiense]|uniref:MBL fold metallo-hydrolase n=1 Tax=Rhodovastum atsumiense TaxID=504468 RepID=UPI00193B3A0E|nr:MBL fold metallo-hydrolase [Rhodovastum atsumiense]
MHGNAGVHHLAIGGITVTALNEGVLQASTELVTGLERSVAEEMLREAFRPVPPRITVSCFLLEFAGRRVLIDAGSGNASGTGLGLARSRLKALDVHPAGIDTVLITHAHFDHVGGLIDEAGNPYFPNAELVLHEAEPAFWLDEANAAQAPEVRRQSFATARRALAPYLQKKLRTVRHGQEALPGITAHHLPGHTPGHCGWVLSSNGDTLLVWGDVIHLPAIQFARPEAGLAYDIDPEQGRATRAQVLDMVATDRLRIAGMHLDFPTFGHVVRAGTGYAFLPEVWRPGAH